jgi:hypothetical protein
MSGITYRWAKGAQVSVDPQVAGETLEAIRDKNDGDLTPETIVDAARRRRSPLHKAFEWDDESAADGYRREQARYILRSIKVVYLETEDKEEKTVRAFVRLSNDEPYQPMIHVLSDPAKAARLLVKARAEMQSWIARYESLEEIAGIVKIARSQLLPMLDQAVVQ